MRLIWTPRALKHLDDLGAFLAEDNPLAAASLIGRLRDRASTLTGSPFQGRAGRVPGTRELFVPGTRYILAYRVQGEQVRVVAVVHTSRLWPKSF